jgi:DNA invertase Pin-like site-specific DNA recombinase
MRKKNGKNGEFVGYARVSTAEQNLDMQLRALRDYPCARIFEDKLSASSMRREGWGDCRRYLRGGDTLVVYSLSRLARSVDQLIAINKDLLSRGIALKSLTEPIDTSTADGKLIFNMRAALAQFERDVTIERTIAGIAARRKAGLLIGRPAQLDRKKKQAIKRDLLAYKLSVVAICKKHGISKQLLGYHFPGGRQAIER